MGSAFLTRLLSGVLYNLYTADIPTQMFNVTVLTFVDDSELISYSRNSNNLRSINLKNMFLIYVVASKIAVVNTVWCQTAFSNLELLQHSQ